MLAQIDTPAEFVQFSQAWHDGQSSILYAIASSRELRCGIFKPSNCETKEEWHVHLYDCLEMELDRLICILERKAESWYKKEIDIAKKFLTWTQEKIAQLNYLYGFDSDNE